MIDWLKQLDKGMDRVTSEALRITDGARKVAGIGVGTVALVVAPRRFELGDVVQGSAALRLEGATQADRVTLTLRAQREQEAIEQRSGGRVGHVRRTTTLHVSTCELAGAGRYHTQRLPFAVHIPSELEPKVDADGVLGDVLKVAQGLRALSLGPIRWTLEAAVVVPWKRNVVGRADLTVG